jgi:monoamine oxidase
VVYDDSPEDGSPGVLFAFVGGDEARSFVAASEGDRRAAVLGNFADYFGPEAQQATSYFETFWPGNRWIRGGPVGIAAPGTLTAYGHALREPVGNVHWAGTESSTFWTGYMDGAVRSGRRAAAEVLAAL